MTLFFKSKFQDKDGRWISRTYVKPTSDAVIKGKWQRKKAKRERMERLNESRSNTLEKV